MKGFALFLTGLSGAGKTTLAQAVERVLVSQHQRAVTLLDGDAVREVLSSGLGFSRADRELNIARIAFVAAEVLRHGGICICSVIAPHANARAAARARIGAQGPFFEVHVATPLAVCEARDPKGLYKRARRGEIRGFTGLDDPYETPQAPELVLDTSVLSLPQAVDALLALPQRAGLLQAAGRAVT